MESTDKRRRRWLKWLIIAPALMLCAMLGLVAVTFLSPPRGLGTKSEPQTIITLAPETTVLTEPLTDRGYVDYIEAVNAATSEGVTPEDNAVVLLWQLRGLSQHSHELRTAYFDHLGIQTPAVTVGILVPLYDLVPRDKNNGAPVTDASEQLQIATGRPWSPDEFPIIAEWIEQNELAFDLVERASRRPRYYAPLVSSSKTDEPMLLTTLLPELESLRTAARMLAARAMLRIHAGQHADAWKDILGIHRLGQISNQHPLLIGQLVSISVSAVGSEAVYAFSLHCPGTPAEFRSRIRELEPLHERQPIAECVTKGERYIFMDTVAAIARNGFDSLDTLESGIDESSAGLLDMISTTTVDWDLVLRTGNQWYDRLAAAMQHSSHAERLQELEAIGSDTKQTFLRTRSVGRAVQALFSRGVRSELMADVMIARLLPAVRSAMDAETQLVARGRLEIVALALAAHRAQHAQYPDELTDLTPDIVAEVPLDPFTEQSFRYRQEGDGYLAYSLGRNLRDDNGDDRELNPESDDISVGRTTK